MTTRSGHCYKVMDDNPQRTQEASEASSTPSNAANSDLPDLARMMQVMLEDRRLREAEIAEDRRRREIENEERMRGMREQIDALQRLITDRGAASTTHRNSSDEGVKLNRLTDQDDIEAYLLTFERMMQAYEISSTRWSYKLAPQLTGKAQQAYAALSCEDAKTYEIVKTAILRRYNITEETYRRQLRAAKLGKDETPRELVTRLQDLVRKWGRDCQTVEDVFDLIVKEQLLNCLPEDARIWVRERKPKTSEEAGELAEDFVQARETRDSEVRTKHRGERREPPGRCPKCGLLGHWARDCPQPRAKEGESKPAEQPKRKEKDIYCFTCKEKGHMSFKCPKSAGLYCDEGGESEEQTEVSTSGDVHRSGRVNGIQVDDIILDTGASRTLVREDLVPPRALRNGEVTIRCAHGDTITYPLADIIISVGPHEKLSVQAAVSKTLPAAVLLGRDVPELMTLLGTQTAEPTNNDPPLVLAVTTRAQAKQQLQEELQSEERMCDSGATPTNPMEGERDGEGMSVPFDFDSSLFPEPREKTRLSRSEKRRNRRERATTTPTDEESHPLEISANELKELQAADPTLEAVRNAASSVAGRGFFVRDGLLYRRYVPPGCDSEEEGVRATEQLVLPKQCREAVLRLAHSVPLAGHLGRNKTVSRILQRFYWPTVFRDAARYCKSCSECQKTSPRRAPRAPLVPLPIIDEPFSRIAMGPLPRSRSGKKYILVICDYATRYPEAVALKSIEAECIAEELMKLFTRVGVPQEILTDQGSNFTSQLLAELYRLLHIRPIKTSPYHPQTDGLVERFNQTLKAMLRRQPSPHHTDVSNFE